MPNTTLPFTLQAISPFITYKPYGDGSADSGWAIADGNLLNQNANSGQSARITSASDALFLFNFTGNAVDIYGQIFPPSDPTSDGSCSLTSTITSTFPGTLPSYINITSVNPSDGVLASFPFLEMAAYTVKGEVECGGGAQFRFYYAAMNVSVGIGLDDHAHVGNWTVDDANSAIAYSSEWTLNTNITVVYYNDTQHYTSSPGSLMSLAFTGSAVALYGSIQPNHGTYAVSLDSSSPQSFNGSTATFSAVPVPLYFAAGLDASTTHNLTLEDTGVDGFYLDVDYLVLWGSTPPPSKPTTKAEIIGSVLGGLLAGIFLLLAIAGIVWWYRNRSRRSMTPDRQRLGSFEIVHAVSPALSPTPLRWQRLSAFGQGGLNTPGMEQAAPLLGGYSAGYAGSSPRTATAPQLPSFVWGGATELGYLNPNGGDTAAIGTAITSSDPTTSSRRPTTSSSGLHHGSGNEGAQTNVSTTTSGAALVVPATGVEAGGRSRTEKQRIAVALNGGEDPPPDYRPGLRVVSNQ